MCPWNTPTRAPSRGRIGDWKGVREISHSGGTAGYRAWLAHYPESGLAVAVLCNASDAPAWILGRQVAELYLGVEASAAPAPDAATTPARDIEGLYRDRRTQEVMTVEVADGQLRVSGLGALTPVAADLFQVGSGAIRLALERTATGTVAGARLAVSGEVSAFDRVERVRPTAGDLRAFAGQFRSDEAEVTLVVAVENGRLVIRRRPNTVIAMTPTYQDAFSGSVGHVQFLRDARGTVTQLRVSRDRVWDLRFTKVAERASRP